MFGFVTRAAAVAVCVLGINGLTFADKITVDGSDLTDSDGRVVILHGVNVVYKHYPWHPSAHQFGVQDADLIKQMGMNSVRLGCLWAGVNPVEGSYNSSYLDEIERIVDMLNEKDIYVLLDFHQDLGNEMFGGEGFPTWAVNTWGFDPWCYPKGTPWALKYYQPGVMATFQSLYWNLDGIQDAYVNSWKQVATRFKDKPNLLGYELINEPFPGLFFLDPSWAPAQLEPFYEELIPAIRDIDSQTPIFFQNSGGASDTDHTVRPDGSGLVYSSHSYCFSLLRGLLHIETWPECCKDELYKQIIEEAYVIAQMQQPPVPMVMTEFGATHQKGELLAATGIAEKFFIGWMYWGWKYWEDPTGNPDEPLAKGDGKDVKLIPGKAKLLTRIYADRISGSPVSTIFEVDGMFNLKYIPDSTISEPTQIQIPALLNWRGMEIDVEGGTYTNSPDRSKIWVTPAVNSDHVSVTITGSPRGR